MLLHLLLLLPLVLRCLLLLLLLVLRRRLLLLPLQPHLVLRMLLGFRLDYLRINSRGLLQEVTAGILICSVP